MDAEYVLHSAFELGELTAKELMVLLHPPQGVKQLEEVLTLLPREQTPDFLANTAQELFTSASPRERALYSLRSIEAVEHGLKFFEQRCNFLVQSLIQQNLDVVQPNKYLLGIAGDTFPRYVAQDSDVNEGVVREVLSAHCLDLAQRWSRDLHDLQRALQWLSQNGAKGLKALDIPLRVLPSTGAQEGQAPHFDTLLAELRKAHSQARQAQKSQARRLRDHARAAVKKATKLFENLGKDSNLRLFVSGQEVELAHPDSIFKFVVKPLRERGWLEDRTQLGRSHTPYELSLLTKDNVHLARLCVYFRDTPVLDQLLSLSLFIESGEEEKLLEKANWFSFGKWDEATRAQVLGAYPQLSAKLPRKERVEDLSLGEGKLRVRLPFEMEQSRAHWQPYQGRVQQWIKTWMEPVSGQLHLLKSQAVLAHELVQGQQALSA